MKLKDGLILRQVAGRYVIVTVGRRTREVRSMVYISQSGAYLWDFMKDREFTVEDLTDRILSHYTGVTRQTAQADIEKFIGVLKKNSILEPEPGDSPADSGFVRVVIRDREK